MMGRFGLSLLLPEPLAGRERPKRGVSSAIGSMPAPARGGSTTDRRRNTPFGSGEAPRRRRRRDERGAEWLHAFSHRGRPPRLFPGRVRDSHKNAPKSARERLSKSRPAAEIRQKLKNFAHVTSMFLKIKTQNEDKREYKNWINWRELPLFQLIDCIIRPSGRDLYLVWHST